MWWIRLAVQSAGGNSRPPSWQPERTDDGKPFQPIDFIEMLAWAASVDLGRSLQAWSDLLDGMSIALLSPEAIR
jgi:hypothetical protein